MKKKTDRTISYARAFNTSRGHVEIFLEIVVFGSEIDNCAIAHRYSIDRLPILAL